MTDPDQADAADDAPRTVVWLGNRAAVDDTIDERKAARMTAEQLAAKGLPRNRVPVPVAKACTRVVIAAGQGLLDAAADVRNLWPRMSDDPAPVWVASTDQRLADLLGDHFDCPVREPEPEALQSPTGFGPYRVTGDQDDDQADGGEG